MAASLLSVVTKGQFLDRPRVLARIDKKRATVLGRTGATTRTAMRRSMRYRKAGGKPSTPPSPPKAQRGNSRIRDSIAFGLADDATVVVGPLVRRSKGGKERPKRRSYNPLEILNEGGTVRVQLPGTVFPNRFVPGPIVSATYAPRPFATPDSPAFKAGLYIFTKLTEKTPL